MGVNSNSNKYRHAHTRGRGEIWPVRFSYNSYFSACFFQPEQCFSLATNQPQCFGLFFQRSERGHVRSELITPSHTVQHTQSTQLRTLIRLIHLQPLMSKSLKLCMAQRTQLCIQLSSHTRVLAVGTTYVTRQMLG